MKEEEVEKIIKIMLEADDSCYFCGSDLVNKFIKIYPQFKVLARNLFYEQHKKELKEDMKYES